LFVLSQHGILIRTKVEQVRSYGRSSQGVTLMRMGEGDVVVAALVMPDEEDLERGMDERKGTKA
ncbi:MAG: DNA gyrase C-terminal beta-propeller domain-containing protein, partial [Deinococcales bacterium]